MRACLISHTKAGTSQHREQAGNETGVKSCVVIEGRVPCGEQTVLPPSPPQYTPRSPSLGHSRLPSIEVSERGSLIDLGVLL